MDIGDVVPLKQPFQPELNNSRTYQFAIIAGFVQDERLPPGAPTSEIVVYLYEPATDTIYTDEIGSQALFFFSRAELSLD